MKELRRNTRAIMAIGGLVIVVAILFIIALGGISINKKDADETYSNNEPIQLTELDINTESDIKLQDILIDYINSGVSGLYTVGDRNFIVLTSGKNNYAHIEYKLDIDKDNNNILKWWYGDIEDNATEGINYIILEANSSDIQVRKESLIFDESTLNGLCEVMVFKYNDKNLVYSINHNTILSNETLNTPGTYMAEFVDGEITSMTKLSKITLKNCTILGRDNQSNRLYRVNVDNQLDLDIYIDKLNVEEGTNCNIQISYDSVLGVFSGTVIGGIV